MLRMRFSKISLFEMVWKRLKLQQFLKVSYRFFAHTSMGVGSGRGIRKFQQKGCFLSFES